MTGAPLTQASTLSGNLLRRCHQISVSSFLRKCEAYNPTRLQHIILSALEERGPVDHVTLGSYIALDRNTVAVVVRKLEERGLVTQRRNPEVRRSMLVLLAAEGKRLRNDAEPAVHATQEEILAPLDEAACESETLCRLPQRTADENKELSRGPLHRVG